MGNNRNIAFWVVLFLLIVVLFNVFSTGSSSMQSREVPFSEFVKNVSGGEISELFIDFSICDTLSIGSKTTKSLSNSFPKHVLEKIIRLNKVCFKNLIFFSI